MNFELQKFQGIFPIIYSFFNKNNSLDKKLISEQIKIIKNIGSQGIASLGLATEVNKLSFSEKKQLIELVAENCHGTIPIAVTIQGSSFNEYVKLIDIAKNNQTDWIILQPLIGKKTTDKDCYRFFNKLIPYVGNTIVGVQNAKEYLGVGLSSNDILKLYKNFDNFRVMKGEASSVHMQSEILKYPEDLRVFNGRGGQEIIDNFLIGCKGIVPSLDSADNFLKIYQFIKNKKIEKANKEYMKILPQIVFVMQSINTLICYGKRICGYRMGVKNIYDRRPFLIPSEYGIKKSKHFAKELGKY
jgi:2-keto-3-deoxy-L-arabinonate dehydratase